MAPQHDEAPKPPYPSGPRTKRRSAWAYVYGIVLIVYIAAFMAVVWIGAGFGKQAASPNAPVAAEPIVVATATVPPTVVPTPTPRPTATAAPPTATPRTATPTPDPNAEFRVPLSASNTGTLQGHRVSILNITDDAKPSTPTARVPAGMKYIAIEVRVENMGDAPVVLGAWKLHATAGNDYSMTFVNSFGDLLPASTILAPRASLMGMIVFSVPTNTKIGWLQYFPTPANRGALYFDVG